MASRIFTQHPGTDQAGIARKFDIQEVRAIRSNPLLVPPRHVPVTTNARDAPRGAVTKRNRVFIFFLQLRETLHGGRVYVFTVLVLVTWVLWCLKAPALPPLPAVGRGLRDHGVRRRSPSSTSRSGLFHEVLDLITEQHRTR